MQLIHKCMIILHILSIKQSYCRIITRTCVQAGLEKQHQSDVKLSERRASLGIMEVQLRASWKFPYTVALSYWGLLIGLPLSRKTPVSRTEKYEFFPVSSQRFVLVSLAYYTSLASYYWTRQRLHPLCRETRVSRHNGSYPLNLSTRVLWLNKEFQGGPRLGLHDAERR